MSPQDRSWSWAAVYAEHGPVMRRVARGFIPGDRAVMGKSADDIVGDVFVELMRKGELGHVENLRSYLIQATRNRAVDVLRRARYEQPVEEISASDAVDVEEIAERRLLAAATAAALDDLPVRERYALEQRVGLGRPAVEVASDLGVTPQRVAQLVNAALGRARGLPAFISVRSIDSKPDDTEGGQP